ncbi:hypothetical protein Taro_045508 [Colocasia esculenta]|uniref:Uncharacterized protein n=1 Tax=Colocasia esculenta TaxID=4460 RepID=A0A843WPN7_COLES|nr:hypothetical protein [Colocasia esculenta]
MKKITLRSSINNIHARAPPQHRYQSGPFGAHPFFPSLFLLATRSFASADAVYNIAYSGARSDSRTDSSAALLTAWSVACRFSTPATSCVPRGTFLVRQATFTGPSDGARTARSPSKLTEKSSLH